MRVGIETLRENLNKCMPKFETQEEAFAYAQRLLQLKAGDKVRLPNREATALHEVIFTGKCNSDGEPIFIWYNSENESLGMQTTGWFAVVLD